MPDRPIRKGPRHRRRGGLGREIAVQLAARGCRVGITDINAVGLRQTAELVGGTGGTALDLRLRPDAEGAPEAAVAKVVDAWGGIDALVNNAGYGVIEPFLDSSFQRLDHGRSP